MKINRAEFSPEFSEEMYNKFLATLRRHLLDGNTVTLKNIGTLGTVRTPAKNMMVGGVSTEIPEAMRIKFKQSRNFKPRPLKLKLSGMDKVLKEMKNE